MSECPCGAIIRLVEGANVWIDERGSALCYPGEGGPDGEARHEPLEYVVVDDD